MKLHLPKMLKCALLTAVMAAPAVYADTPTGTTLAIDSFTAENLQTLTNDGWTLTNITGSENGKYTSTGNRADITAPSGTALSTLQPGTNDRYRWAAVVTVDIASLKKAILMQAKSGGTLGMGIGWDGDGDIGSVTGVWQGTNPYSTMSIPSFSSVYGNGDGTITLGISYQGSNGTTICIGAQTESNNGLKWGNKTDKILLSNVEGVTYENLYWFNDSLTEADLKAAVSTVGSVNTGSYTWNGTGATGEWNFTSANWTKEGEAAAISNGATTITFGNSADIAKDISVGSSVGAAVMNVQDDYTFRMADGAQLQTVNLTIANGKTMTVDGEVMVGSLSSTGKLSATSVSITDAMLLTRGSANLDTTDLHLVASSALANATKTTYTGNLTVEEGVTLRTTNGKVAPSNLSSISNIILNGGTLSSESAIGDLQTVTVTSKGANILYTDFPDKESGQFVKTDTWNNLVLGGALKLHTTYKSNTVINALSGTGTLTASSDNRTDAGNNLSIKSLEGFTGNITLQPGSTNNAVALSIVNDTADGTVNTVTMKNGSTLNISGSHALTAGKILMTGGTLTIDGTVNATQLMMSQEGGTAGAITVNAGAILHITGTVTNAELNKGGGSFELCNWAAANTMTIHGSVISEAGITMEGGGQPVVNIEDGGSLTMNAGLKVAIRQGTPLTTINVKNGGTLKAAGTDTLANTDKITVNLKDGATLGGAYGTGTTAVINKDFVLEDNATVKLQTEANKTLTLNGTLSNATASLIAQGGGEVALGGTANIAALTMQDNTHVVIAADTNIGSVFTNAGALTINNDKTLTVKGLVSTAGTINGTGTLHIQTGGTNNNTTLDFDTISAGTTLHLHQAEGVLEAAGSAIQNTILLTNGGAYDGGHAAAEWKNVKGTSYTFSGAITGGGNFVFNGTDGEKNVALTFTGDLSEWTSSAKSYNGLRAAGGMHLDVTISGSQTTAVANAFNADTVTGTDSAKGGGTMNLTVDRDVTLNGSVQVNKLTVNAGKTVSTTHSDVKIQDAITLSDGSSLTIGGTAAQTTGSLTMGSGAELTLGNHNVKLTTSSLTVTGDSTLNANLVVSGGTLTFANDAVLTMGCTVSIGDDVTVVLTQEMVESIATGTWVEIIANVEGIATLGQHATFVGAEGVTLDQPTAYHLTQIGDKIYITPEPATTTLSLLALAALAARRKRH